MSSDISLKIEFLYRSIDDTQSTIRGLDVKAGFMVIVMFFPIVGLDKVFGVVYALSSVSEIYVFFMVLVVILWASSLYVLFKVVLPISNPSSCIDEPKPSGVFYSPVMFNFFLKNYFINSVVKANKSFSEYLSLIPVDGGGVLKELAYEKIKVSYIRDIKIYRLSMSIVFSFWWVLMGSALWLANLMKIGI